MISKNVKDWISSEYSEATANAVEEIYQAGNHSELSILEAISHAEFQLSGFTEDELEQSIDCQVVEINPENAEN